jgi:hypothetical protein
MIQDYTSTILHPVSELKPFLPRHLSLIPQHHNPRFLKSNIPILPLRHLGSPLKQFLEIRPNPSGDALQLLLISQLKVIEK